jgi:hypothetical protein
MGTRELGVVLGLHAGVLVDDRAVAGVMLIQGDAVMR